MALTDAQIKALKPEASRSPKVHGSGLLNDFRTLAEKIGVSVAKLLAREGYALRQPFNCREK